MPKLTVGLPVYNGERYLAQAIEAYLAQTYTDFELIISDNASTDTTADICQHFAHRDARIRYSRNPQNLGAGPNLNKVFELSRPTPYFKWTAADDIYAPTYLQQTMAVLEQDTSVVLCHSRTTVIDESGQPMTIVGGPKGHYASGPASVPLNGHPIHTTRWEDHYDRQRKLNSVSLPERFREIILGTRRCFEIWGVMRRQAILRTHLHESYYGSDKVMLSALSLAGRFIEVPEPLYFRRHHGGSSDAIRSGRARNAWMDTRRTTKPVQNARLACFNGYRRSLTEANLPLADRIFCYMTLAQHLMQGERWMAMLREPR